MGGLNVDACIATLQSGECVSERELKYLCQHVSELLMEESNVQPVLSPVTVVGDLHGQFFDLIHLLSPAIGGWPPQTSYVFLGDFVDRGHNSVETLSLLLALKLKYPGHVTLLRGNHEVSVYICILYISIKKWGCCFFLPSCCWGGMDKKSLFTCIQSSLTLAQTLTRSNSLSRTISFYVSFAFFRSDSIRLTKRFRF
jgi:hypothetical protein